LTIIAVGQAVNAILDEAGKEAIVVVRELDVAVGECSDNMIYFSMVSAENPLR
jgi:hypothetical protein